VSLYSPIVGAAVSILIGLLLGLERERSRAKDEELFAGIRTFPILSLCGYLAASARDASLVLPAVLLGIAALAVAAYLR
jgi:MgtC family